MRGFEPLTSCSEGNRSVQTELHALFDGIELLANRTAKNALSMVNSILVLLNTCMPELSVCKKGLRILC